MTSQVGRNIVKFSHQKYILLFILNFGNQEDVFFGFTFLLYFFKLSAENGF